MLAYGFYARVFWCQNNECTNTLESTFHAVICLFGLDIQPQPEFHSLFSRANVNCFYFFWMQALCRFFKNLNYVNTERMKDANAVMTLLENEPKKFRFWTGFEHATFAVPQYFRTVCVPRHQSTLQRSGSFVWFFFRLPFFTPLAFSFQTFPCLVKLFDLDNTSGISGSLRSRRVSQESVCSAIPVCIF